MKRWKKWSWAGTLLFLAANGMAFMHAWRFTHFSGNEPRTRKPQEMGLGSKLAVLFTGVDNPRPLNDTLPLCAYKEFTIPVKEGANLSAWMFEPEKAEQSKGTVIFCHGYASRKASQLYEALRFTSEGYRVILFDFRGSGDSGGNTVTLGYYEAEDVKAIYDHVRYNMREENIFLYGMSMGSVAILRSIAEYGLRPTAVVAECPFNSMTTAVENRFKLMNVPAFPFAYMLVFWGGVQHGFNAFEHSTVAYAGRIKVPVLLMYGTEDPTITAGEMKEIKAVLPASSQLVAFEGALHQSLMKYDEEKWAAHVLPYMRQFTP